ncbi:hypothetical protein [Cupriavidus sp. TMH.W2]|uniref:hypothetical protein n=1 Tax=Cupriavidus sp. TMH.W2 TaxID=3434465 RepID=UPI003D76F6B7
MDIDFRALLDPAKMREAEREREQQAKEKADHGARMRAALAALGRIEEAGRLNDTEARFVRSATARWGQTGFLTGPQVEWVTDLAGRHCFVLQAPAGTYIEPEANGYVVRSALRQGCATVVVPDVGALIELGREERWSDLDIEAIKRRWGRRQQTQDCAPGRFTFGPSLQPALADEPVRQEFQRQRGGA